MGLHGFKGFSGVSVFPHSLWLQPPRQTDDKPSPAGLAQQEGVAGGDRGGRGGLATQASWKGWLLGSPWGPPLSGP